MKTAVFRLNSAKISKVVNLGGELAGAKRLACIWVVSWQERSDWLVFRWAVGRSGATGLYLGGLLAGAEQRDVFSLFNSYFQDPRTVPNAGRMPKKQFLILIFSTTK